MIDPREDIIARLLAIVAGVSGIASAARNRKLLADDALPAVQILDGNETADEKDPRSRGALAPRRVTMTPIVMLSVMEKAETVGTTLNSYRSAIIEAVLSDATLVSLTGTNGDMRYGGATQMLDDGTKGVVGGLGLAFEITYILRPHSA